MGGRGIGTAYCRGFAAEAATKDIREKWVRGGGRRCGRRFRGGDAAHGADDARPIRAIHALINNAAIFATVPMSRVPIEEVPVAVWDRLMTVNLRGTFLSCRAVPKAMREQDSGSVINISSETALSGSPSRIHHVTSKAGILGFSRCLAREVGAAGIRVNTIAPGNTLTEPDPDGSILARHSNRVEARALPHVQHPDALVSSAATRASSLSETGSWV